MSATASAEARASRSESPYRVSRTASWFRRLVAAGVERWSAWRVSRRDERILRNVPAYMLTDMGIDRAELRRAMRGEREQPTASPKPPSAIPTSARQPHGQNTVADQRVRDSRTFR
jgi:hypothetical protein